MERMNKLVLIIVLIPLLLTACVREFWLDRNTGSEGIVISFGATPSPDVLVSTKGALSVDTIMLDGQGSPLGEYKE